ncbi:MAG: TonB-dependent receptor [Dysgonomonas sp.]|nr:TonB-dependent receptor [Dysgonomonas sp.]
MKKLYSLLLFYFMVIFSYAQSGGLVSGIVKDKKAISLPGATLKLDKFNRYTVSDHNGYFEFLNVPEGTYTLEVSYIGFTSFTKTVAVNSKENTVIDVILEEKGITAGEVVVMGEMLKGQAKALNQQKTNSNITNIISSDQVGRFPDSNIGDALKRVTGITMQNDQGEARNIIIRGIASHLNSVTLNGNRIPSAEGDNRNIQMDLIPADMISSIEVNKTLTSDMDADAIGGSVDLITRATPNKQRISATLSGGYNPIREKYMYSGAFVYGNRFLDSKLGVVVSGSLQNKEYGSDNIEAEWDQDKDNNNEAYIQTFDIRRYDVQRIRRSVSSSIDYRFDANNSIAADIIYNWRDDRENRYRVRYKDMKPVYNGNNLTGYKGEIQRETKGGIDNNRNKNTRLEDQRVQNYLLRGQHLLSEKLDLDWNLSYSRASEDRPNERYISFRQKGVMMTQDLSDERHPFITVPEEDLSDMKLKDLTENHNYTKEDEYSIKINARTPLSVIEDQKGRLRFGLRARFKNKKRDNLFYKYEPVSGIETLDDVPQNYYDGKNFQPGNQYVPGTFVTKKYLGSLDLKNPSLFKEELAPEEYLASNYKAKEKIVAGYLRWDQNLSNDMVIILGVRAEGTFINYTGNYVMDDESQEEIKDKNSYVNILPNITYKYSIMDNLILRAAYTTALARPNYYDLVPYTNVNSEKGEISVGNSDLKVTYSHNFDLMGEYYLSSVGLLSAGVFYKKLNNFIYKYKDIQYTTEKYTEDFPELSNPIPTGEKWTFAQSRNGKGVDVLGFEIAFQRNLDFLPTQFLKNFAVYLNYTYTYSNAKGIADEDGNERKDVDLPGTAPHMFNASLSWENKKFAARASLNTTASYIDVLGATEFSDSYYDKQLFLDVNASYKIIPSLRVFAEANNLTNQPLRYYQGTKDRMMQLEYYKPTFNLGIKYDF